MIDTHAHIYSKAFKDDLSMLLEKCREINVSKIFMPNIDHSSIDLMLEVENKAPETCFSMMGLHPASVNEKFEKELYLVEEWLNKRTFLAVGEIGMDLYWDKTFQKEQEEAFKIQIGLAKKFQTPVVIHCREAFDETIAIVESLNDETLSGVFHCFTGTLEQANKVIDLGFYLGIGGVATFKNGGLDKVLPEISLEKIVLETDSPYLAPVPFRGKRNEPAYLPLIAQRVADLIAVDVAVVEEATTTNAEMLFLNKNS